ncbi:hypothetical protein BDZ97DRAFT_1841709 [Flammula alnicola]|nr:hypothetical protein BDZ97DRAFT_1841709 [Flammula alnicola]
MSKQTERLEFLQSRLPEDVIAGITGNASPEIKEIPLKWLSVFRNKGKGFAGDIAGRVRVTDVSIVASVDDPLKMEGKVTMEITVTPDMCNGQGVLDEGCIVFLIDECSTTAMVVINAYDGLNTPPGVSQVINTFYHSTAIVGTTLRIVNRSVATGRESNAGKTELWDTANHRLVASGTQLTMPPSIPPKWMAN